MKKNKSFSIFATLKRKSLNTVMISNYRLLNRQKYKMNMLDSKRLYFEYTRKTNGPYTPP